MARNDGIDRVCARNAGYKETKIGKVQRHNERENEEYSNPDIIRERSHLNIHYKEPTGSYGEMFRQMVQDKVISTRGSQGNGRPLLRAGLRCEYSVLPQPRRLRVRQEIL